MLKKTLGAGAALIIVTALSACSGPSGSISAAAAIVPASSTRTGSAAVGAASGRVGPARLGPVPAGQRPPQVVVFAFDDSGNAVENTDGHYAIFDYWRQVSRAYNARMTFFLSGPMLLTSQTLHTYDAPQLGPGTDHMGFAFNHAETLPGETQLQAVRHEMENLKAAYAEGNEIGTHYGGHICGSTKGNVGSFSAADWEHEIEQFDKMVDQANRTNNLNPPVNLGFTSKDIDGSRTPCLEGNFHNLYPVLAKHGYIYDTSPIPQVRWPFRGASNTGPTNLWTFPIPVWHMYGSTHDELGMDYNICDWHQKDCLDEPVSQATADQWSQQMLDTERAAFEQSYTGDRAPVFFGNHPEMWNHGAYTRAIASIAKEVCSKPEVRCVTNRELAEWLNKDVPAAQLDSWRKGAFPHYVDPSPPAYGKPVPNVLMPAPVTARPDQGTHSEPPVKHSPRPATLGGSSSPPASPRAATPPSTSHAPKKPATAAPVATTPPRRPTPKSG